MRDPDKEIIDNTLIELLILMLFMFFLYVSEVSSPGYDEGVQETIPRTRFVSVSLDTAPCIYRFKDETRKERGIFALPQFAVEVTPDPETGRDRYSFVRRGIYDRARHFSEEGARSEEGASPNDLVTDAETISQMDAVIDSVRLPERRMSPDVASLRYINVNRQRGDSIRAQFLTREEFKRLGERLNEYADGIETYGRKCRFFADIYIDPSVESAITSSQTFTNSFFIYNGQEFERQLRAWDDANNPSSTTASSARR